MVSYITSSIERKARLSTAQGRDHYIAYFVKTRRYAEFREDVDANLRIDGFDECIVTD